MTGIFDQPKVPAATPTVNPADTQNRMNNALEQRLNAGGTSSTLLAQYAAGAAATGQGKQPTVTGMG